MKFNRREQTEGSGIFLRLKDGETVKGVFRGECYEFFQKWVNNKSVLSHPEDAEAKSRFRLNFITAPDGKTLVSRIWEFPTSFYNKLADLAEDYDLSKTKVRITRMGVGTETEYMVVPLPEPISAASMKLIEAVELHVLNHKDEQQKPAVKNYAPGSASESEFP